MDIILFNNGQNLPNNEEEVKNKILQNIIDGKSFTFVQDDGDGDVWKTLVEVTEQELIRKL